MAKARTLLFLGADLQSAYDVSARAHPLASRGRVRILKDQRTLSFSGGRLEISRSKELESLNAFTVEARVIPRRQQRRWQNILEGQTPPIALYLERTGKLVGAAHTRSGWKSVDSGKKRVPAGRRTNIRLTRNTQGVLCRS